MKVARTTKDRIVAADAAQNAAGLPATERWEGLLLASEGPERLLMAAIWREGLLLASEGPERLLMAAIRREGLLLSHCIPAGRWVELTAYSAHIAHTLMHLPTDIARHPVAPFSSVVSSISPHLTTRRPYKPLGVFTYSGFV